MIRVFVGTSEGTDDLPAEKALKYSLEKNCSEDIEVIFMRNLEDGFMGKFDCAGWATPFTNLRWAVPEYCNFEGKAIYTDVDMLNFRDIGDLFDLEIPEGKLCLARDGKRFGGKEFCVMLFDCARWKSVIQPSEQWKHVDHFHQQYIQLMIQNNVVGDLDPRWNSHDGDVDPFWILHYTHFLTGVCVSASAGTTRD